MARYNDLQGEGRAGQSRAGQVIGPETALAVLALLVYLLRMFSRVRPTRNLSWDDLFITLGVICGLGNYIVSVMSVPNGYGKHIEFAGPAQIENFSRLAFISEPLWVWSLTFTKISIAFLFLRIRKSPVWKTIMGCTIFYLVASAIVTTALQFTECVPLRMYWEKVPGGKCRSPRSVQRAIIGTSVVFIVSDVLFSLLPITFIVQIRCSRFEKLVLTFIMGLGMFASISGIIKLVGITQWAATKDPTWDLVPLLVWSYGEEFIAIIAACIPCLKGPFTRMFQSITGRLSSKSSKAGHTTDASAGESAGKSRNMSDADTDIKVCVTVDVEEG